MRNRITVVYGIKKTMVSTSSLLEADFVRGYADQKTGFSLVGKIFGGKNGF